MAEYQHLHSIPFQGGIEASAAQLSPDAQNAPSAGTWNTIIAGNGHTRAFGGMTPIGPATGSRKMLQIGRTWGGIKDIGGTQGSGNFWEDKGKSRWGIGAGKPHIEGVDIANFTLSTILQVSVKSSGVYQTPVQAGLGQPSAPEIGITSTIGDINASISAKIERRRPSTGARSVASPTSAVVFPQGHRVRVTFPLASAGQTHWRVFFTFQGFGGVGVHYNCQYNGASDIPESVIAAGSVGGIARSLEFNFADGDLIPLEASYDDYAPPAATHAIRLQNVLNLVGANADTVSAPTSSSPGTVISCSKTNAYESHVPGHELFLPEQVTDVQSRPIDDFGYIACENSIHAIQYVGYRGDELPACVITTILPDIGVLYPHNWCYFRGQLLLYTAEGNLMLMDKNGDFDTDFAGAMVSILKKFLPENTIVGYCPKNDSIICASGRRILVYSLAKRAWRQIWLPDVGVYGLVRSCVTANRKLYISIKPETDTELRIITTSITGGTNLLDILSGASFTSMDIGRTLYFAPTGLNRQIKALNSPTQAVLSDNYPFTHFGSECIVLDASFTNNAFSFDTNILQVPLSFVSNYTDAPTGSGLVKDIWEISLSTDTSLFTQMAICLGKNLGRISFRSIKLTNASNILTNPENTFTQMMVGQKVIIFGDGVGGVGTEYQIGKISQYISPSEIRITKADGSAYAAPKTVEHLLMFCGNHIALANVASPESRHFRNFFPNLAECRSYAAAVWFKSNSDGGNVLSFDVFGTTYASSRAK